MIHAQRGEHLLLVFALFLSFAVQPCAKELEWFIGGTLHNTTMRDWGNATPRNRLATCGDWIAAFWNKGQSTKQYKSMNEIKKDAENLRIRMDLAVGLDVAKDSDSTAETALQLMILMNLIK